MITSFRVQGFRGLDTRVDWGRLNVLIGPNGTGKTNLIRAQSLFSQLIDPDASGLATTSRELSTFHRVIQHHGWTDQLSRREPPPATISTQWTLALEDSQARPIPPLSYALNYQVGSPDQLPHGFFVVQESLAYTSPQNEEREPYCFFEAHKKQAGGPGRGRFAVQDTQRKARRETLDVRTSETVFQQLRDLLEQPRFAAEMYPRFADVMKHCSRFVSRQRHYEGSLLNLTSASQPGQAPLGERLLEPRGTNLVAVLASLNEDDQLTRLSAALRELDPSIKHLLVKRVTDTSHQGYLSTSQGAFKVLELSHGTLRALMLATILWNQPKSYSTLTLDEPELGLHPAWLRVVGGWLARSDAFQQAIVSTHSPDLLDALTEGFVKGEVRVFVSNRDRDIAVKRLDPAALHEQLQQGWQLGDLYRVGDPTLGGWPW